MPFVTTYTDHRNQTIKYLPVLIDSYRGFDILREGPHFLYYIATLNGFDITPKLRGNYTKIATVRDAIDKWYTENPTAGPNDAFTKIEVKRGRGRPPKQRSSEQQEQESEAQSNNEQISVLH